MDPDWLRSHEHLAGFTSAVSSNGRIFYILDEGLISTIAAQLKWSLFTRDAFNGKLL